MADILHMISVISFVAAGVFVVVAIVIWFAFKIPSVMGDLSGRTARKSIERMRQNNERTGNKSYKTSERNLERGKLTGTMEGINGTSMNSNEETGLLNENLARNYEVQETSLLIDGSTEPLEILGETAPLEVTSKQNVRPPSSIYVQLIDEIMLVHTEENIL